MSDFMLSDALADLFHHGLIFCLPKFKGDIRSVIERWQASEDDSAGAEDETIERIKGDMRMLEILQTNDEQANKNLGDPASFLCVYDPEREAEKVAEIMAEGTSLEQFEAKIDAAQASSEEPDTDEEGGGGRWLLELFKPALATGESPIPSAPSTDSIRNGITLFGDSILSADYAFAKTALQELSRPNPVANFSTDDPSQTITITAPLDLQQRLRVTLPIEVRDADHRYSLCSNKSRIAEEIEKARQAKKGEESWPSLHYLWQQHPIMDWLSDRVLTAFGRHRAPSFAALKWRMMNKRLS